MLVSKEPDGLKTIRLSLAVGERIMLMVHFYAYMGTVIGSKYSIQVQILMFIRILGFSSSDYHSIGYVEM